MKKIILLVLSVLLLLVVVACEEGVEEGASAQRAANEPPQEESPEVEEGEGEEESCLGGSTAPAIAGTYTDNYGHTQIIEEGRWTIQLKAELKDSPLVEGLTHSNHTFCSVDNERGVIIAQNAANQYHPEKFSQFNWTRVDDQLWFCQVTTDAATLREAATHPPADPSNPAGGGCGEFPWSTLATS